MGSIHSDKQYNIMIRVDTIHYSAVGGMLMLGPHAPLAHNAV